MRRQRFSGHVQFRHMSASGSLNWAFSQFFFPTERRPKSSSSNYMEPHSTRSSPSAGHGTLTPRVRVYALSVILRHFQAPRIRNDTTSNALMSTKGGQDAMSKVLERVATILTRGPLQDDKIIVAVVGGVLPNTASMAVSVTRAQECVQVVPSFIYSSHQP